MEFLKEIPKEVWGASVEVINKLIYPITATTVGIGKLIEQKFSTLNDVQKLIAEQTLREAADKISKANKSDFTNVVVKPQVIYTVLENSDSQSDDFIRSLWANVTARELSEGSVHPEIVRLFAKLTAPDLMVLTELYAENSSVTKMLFKTLSSAYTLGISRDPKSFHHVYLSDLGLIDDVSGKWFITTKGKELMRCIGELEQNC
ncbi:hypothetical protein ACFFUP_16005 [Vibrio ostreicida]|uniref:DUF4393 domain-containing protein n=1 Tax=Vibrio ostreicida TaxID=526588 RepID=A0ABT8BRU8_9VIBR|nr:hypothetical protein [Vibrio ostreicida]MDN3609810.1 hypothetical protein [Vibrio ostreicida]NPD09367.1 hypothetical protein [Vibrio ostreicida]